MSARNAGTHRASRRGLVTSLLVTLIAILGTFGIVLGLQWSPKLGLDLAGGLSVVYQPQGHPSQADLAQTVTIINNRVNSLGVSGATVVKQGTNIVVSVPGVTDARAVLATVGQTAQSLFRPTYCYAPPFIGNKSKYAAPAGIALPTSCGKYQLSAANLGVTPNPNLPAGYSANNIPAYPVMAAYRTTLPAADLATKTVLLPGLGGEKQGRYLLGAAQLTGRVIKGASATQNQVGQWVVNYTLTAAGSSQWDAVAQANFHQIVAIELDGVVQSAPLIQPTQATFTSFGGSGQISGSMSQSQAQNLATAMEFGALPVRLTALTTQTVSPTLGHSSLVAGLAAGVVGLLLVLLYTLIYYRALGLVIIAGLGLTAMALWTIVSALGHTTLAPSFSLAGVTGLIVSIGITVDSYIVYFERLKDEARSGRSVRISVDRGFQSAWRTVLAADFVSLLAAVVLYLVALGDVRGFAFFLGLSTILDIVMTYFFTRPLVILLGRRGESASEGAFSISRGLLADSHAQDSEDVALEVVS